MATLLLMDKDTDPATLTYCEEQLSKGGFDYTSSTDEWLKSFATHGTYEGWSSHLATGVDYLSRSPLFTKFCCAEKHLGRGNALIITKALAAGKECFWFDGTKPCPIVGVDTYADDYANGWRISVIGETST